LKNLSPEIQNHIESDVTTLCRCWILETTAGQKLGFTDHDETITVEGVLCEKDAGVEASGIEERLGLNTNTSEVSGAIQSDYITREAITAGKFDNAQVSTYIVNWQDASQYFLDQVSLVGEIVQEDGHYRMELRSLSSKLEQTKGNHFIKNCQADLGDDKCKVNLSTSEFRSIGNISQVKSQTILWIKGIDDFENAWFRGGFLTFNTGANKDLKMEISEHIKLDGITILHLWQPMPNPIKVGDNFSVVVGCNKSFSTCGEKFSNTINFRGFPHMPGNAFALSYAGNSDNFDGEPIIK